MISREERLKILKMVRDGKIGAEDAADLLLALDEARSSAKPQPSTPPPGVWKNRTFRVRVTDSDTGKVRVNVQLPLSVVSAGLKMGVKFAPQIEGLDTAQLAEAIQTGEMGRIVDVFDEEDGEHVEVFIE
jgi:hypothetical protein